jgi:hypothetical protein
MGWWVDLLATYTHHSDLQVTKALPLIFTIHKSPQHPLSLFQPAVYSPAVPWQRLLTMEILQLPAIRSSLHSLPRRTQLSVWGTFRSSRHRLAFNRQLTGNHFARTGNIVWNNNSIVVGVCLKISCLETGCITTLFYCRLRVRCGRYLATTAVYRVTA